MSTLLSFLHWADHFFALFTKLHKFVQNSVFSPRSAHTVIFALGAPLLTSFQLSARVSPKGKTALLALDQHVLSFSHCAHHFLAFSAKFTSLFKTEFSARDKHVLPFSHWAHHFLAIFSKVQ